MYFAGGQESRRNPAGCQQGGNIDGIGGSGVWSRRSALYGSVDRGLGRRGSTVDSGDGGTSRETESERWQVVDAVSQN